MGGENIVNGEGSDVKKTPTYTLAEGCPYASPRTSRQLRTGRGGLVLLQDTQLIETLAHFARERIPERVVHAKAAGAYGVFTVTHDNSDITDAAFLNGIGKETRCLWRVSTVGPERGSADVIRDVRGWALKLYTEEGNQDWVFNNSPVFFVRDPVKFPSLNRSHKRNPQTNLSDADMFWDFHTNNQESIHQTMYLFSDRGIPANIRHMNGYSGHTYKFTKADGSFVYVKIHIISNHGFRTMASLVADSITGAQPDAFTEDLFSAIARGDYPTWTVSAQVMTAEQSESYRWNVFDMTKVWPHADFPLRPLGTLKMDRNPRNYFTDIEQAAFSPSNMVPGIAPSADPMLQARMFSYPDAQRYRLGVNYQMLPTNRAHCPVYSPFQRDGHMNFTDNYNGDDNYVGTTRNPINFEKKSSFGGAVTQEFLKHEHWAGEVSDFESEVTDEDFVQPRMFWENVLGKQEGGQERLVLAVAGHLSGATPRVRGEAYKMFGRVDTKLGTWLQEATEMAVVVNEQTKIEL